MTHLDEGQLLAVRDDEAQHEHLAECARCRHGLDELHSRRHVVSSALGALDAPTDLEAARARVRERVAAQRSDAAAVVPLAPRPRRALWSLSRAAGLLLVTAAGLSALPGSPVRGWVARVLAPGPDGTPSQAITAPTTETTPTASEERGVRMAVPRGPLRVVILGAAAGDEIRVRWIPGAEAAVFAPEGSRFTSGEGRLEARITSGLVRVELPRGVVPVSLEVGGRIYLRRTDAGLDVPGPVAEQSATDIVFRIP